MLTKAFFKNPSAASQGRRILAEVCKNCRAEEATLWLISRDGNSMEGTLNQGATPHILENASVPVSQSQTGLVAATGIGLCLGPEAKFNPTVDQSTGLRTRAMVAAPFRHESEIAGVLTAINPIQREQFDATDLEELSWRTHILELLVEDLAKSLPHL
ncbi:MAG: GAF domain-containing protein [Candidatus Acidiferrum sp.]|jgi:hypothetical protein